MENYPFRCNLEAELLEIKVRLSIFTFISVCAGLPALVWSVSDLIHHRKNGHRISVFIVLLLLTDFIELLLSPYILIKLIFDEIPSCKGWPIWFFGALWWASRVCGLLLNQLVALEGILSVKYPLYTACLFSSPCLIFLYILVFLLIFFFHIVLPFMYKYFIYVLVLIASLITWIISCRASCSDDPHSSRKPDRHILVIFILTLLVFYLPFIAFYFYLYFTQSLPNIPLWHIPIFLVSVRLISDPLLCVLVCRQDLRSQTPQNPEESSLV